MTTLAQARPGRHRGVQLQGGGQEGQHQAGGAAPARDHDKVDQGQK